jgi:hypothetical protein
MKSNSPVIPSRMLLSFIIMTILIISQHSLLLNIVRVIFHSTLQFHIFILDKGLFSKFELLIGEIKCFTRILKSHRPAL